MSEERQVSITDVLTRHIPEVRRSVHPMSKKVTVESVCMGCGHLHPCDARDMAEALAALATPEGLAAFLVANNLPLPEEVAALRRGVKEREQDEVAQFLDKLEAGLRKMPERERARVLSFGDNMIAQVEENE